MCTTMVRLADCFSVVTPIWRTMSGRRGSARLMRFCTAVSATSGTVPIWKVTVMVTLPSAVAWLSKYSMLSRPLICSSRGAATVSEITRGLAPGNWARTTMRGGDTSGYSETGSWKIDSSPTSTMKIDRTMAKRGRSMKKCEMSMAGRLSFFIGLGSFGRARWRTRRQRPAMLVQLHHGRRDGRAGKGPQQAVHHHQFARLDALDGAHAIDQGARLDGPLFDDVVLADDEDHLAGLVGGNRPVADDDGRVLAAADQLDAGEQAGRIKPILVVEHGTPADRGGGGIETVVNEIHLASVRKTLFVGQAQVHGIRCIAARGPAAVARLAHVFQINGFAGVEIGV